MALLELQGAPNDKRGQPFLANSGPDFPDIALILQDATERVVDHLLA